MVKTIKIEIEFDLSLLSLEDVKQLKKIAIKQQLFEKAATLLNYERHLQHVLDNNSKQKD